MEESIYKVSVPFGDIVNFASNIFNSHDQMLANYVSAWICSEKPEQLLNRFTAALLLLTVGG